MSLKQSLFAFVLPVLVACSSNPVPRTNAQDRGLYHADKPEAVLAAARKLMESDENAALVTVDSDGQPRARTVRAFLSDKNPSDPRSSMTVWVMTRDSTRKVEQVRNHRQATLYFNDDPKTSYLSVMGQAIVHTNPEHPAIRAILSRKDMEGYAEYFWPQFPSGFVMIEIRPDWIEFMDPTEIKPQTQNWRPQAVEFGKAAH